MHDHIDRFIIRRRIMLRRIIFRRIIRCRIMFRRIMLLRIMFRRIMRRSDICTVLSALSGASICAGLAGAAIEGLAP